MRVKTPEEGMLQQYEKFRYRQVWDDDGNGVELQQVASQV